MLASSIASLTCPGSYFSVMNVGVLNTIYILFNLHSPWYCSIVVLFSLFGLKYQWIICLFFVLWLCSWAELFIDTMYHLDTLHQHLLFKAGHLSGLSTYDKFHRFSLRNKFLALFFHLFVDILPIKLSDL